MTPRSSKAATSFFLFFFFFLHDSWRDFGGVSLLFLLYFFFRFFTPFGAPVVIRWTNSGVWNSVVFYFTFFFLGYFFFFFFFFLLFGFRLPSRRSRKRRRPWTTENVFKIYLFFWGCFFLSVVPWNDPKGDRVAGGGNRNSKTHKKKTKTKNNRKPGRQPRAVT